MSKQRRAERLPSATERAAFLAELAAGWSVTKAAKQAGVERRRFYEARDQDEAFAAAWAEAFDQGTDALEDELHRRATEGFTERTFDGAGKLVRSVQRIAGNELLATLKARRPEKYRENGPQVQVHATAIAAAVDVKRRPDDLTVVDMLRFSLSLGEDGHKAVVAGLVNAAERRGLLTEEYVAELNAACRQADGSPSWMEHPGPLALEPGSLALVDEPGRVRSGSGVELLTGIAQLGAAEDES